MQQKTKQITLGLFIIAILLRLWGVTNDLNDYHHFRQTYTASFAKYFYEFSMDIFSPNLDILNYKNISEFQLYSFLVAGLYKIFGYHDILGRFVSIFFSLFNFWLLHFLVKRYYDSITAVFASFLFAILPLSVYYSRVFMLESMMLFLSLSSIYYATKWIDTGKIQWMLVAALFSALTLLIKIPTLYILIPIAFLIFWKGKWKAFANYQNYLYLVLSFIPAFYWYFLHPKLFPGNSIMDEGMTQVYYSKDAWDYYLTLMRYSNTWKQIFFVSIAEYHMALSGFFFFLGGVYLKVRSTLGKTSPAYSPESWMFVAWTLGFIFFIVVFIAPNLAHEYYQLPIELPMIAIASYFLRSIYEIFEKPNRTKAETTWVYLNIFLLVAIIPFSINKLKSRLTPDLFYNRFANELNQYTKKEELIIVVDNTPRTEVFYFANRRGYQLIIPGAFQIIVPPDKEFQKKYFDEIESYREKGAKYLVTPYIEFAGFLPWLKEYLDERYKCILGCDITKEDVLSKSAKIRGYIYDLSQPASK